MSPRVVLMYHRVNRIAPDPWNLAVTPEHFAEQVAVLREVTEIRPLARFAEASARPVSAITFDDGYHDNLAFALPVLEHWEAPATIFVVSGMVGSRREMWWDLLDRLLLQPPTHPDWDWDDPDPTPLHGAYRGLFEVVRGAPLSISLRGVSGFENLCGFHEARPERRMMTADEVGRMHASGLVEIGAHTVHHPVLSQLAHADQWEEIWASKRELEEITGSEVSSFAYPNGYPADYTAETVDLVREAGFRRACSAFEAPIRDHLDHFQIPRMTVRDWDGEVFRSMLQKTLEAGGHGNL